MLNQFVPTEITVEDRKRFARVMGNWTHLNIFLSTARPGAPLLGLLIRYELEHNNRRDILERLISKLVSQIRIQLKQEMGVLHAGKGGRALPRKKSEGE